LEQFVHRRACKLRNPLDFETCQVSRRSDRRRVAQLVEIAKTVPALEVFADRQPVEFGLTEVVEQSLAQRLPLPSTWDAGVSGPTASDSKSVVTSMTTGSMATSVTYPKMPEPDLWLTPVEASRADWRLVVIAAGEAVASTLTELADAMVWVDHGLEPAKEPPSPDEVKCEIAVYCCG